ncbi:MAG TPA: hypothetical protein VKV74_12600 [Bryobacteraceae bacterium]|nr:hypothetical protein [Bryobacteraceae bacterium]
MPEDSPIRLRLLPDGAPSEGVLVSSRGRVLEIELPNPPVECVPGAPAELENEREIFLGAVGRRQDNRIWLNVEHRLDRTPLAALRAAWKEA